MKYHATLFDLDGTLLDTLEDLANSVNRALVKHKMPTHGLDAYRYFVGDGARNLVRRAIPEERRDDATVSKLLDEYRADYAVNWRVATRPYAGVTEMLNALRDRGVRMTIVSNKPDDATHKCVEALLPDWEFDIVLGERTNVPLKPDPAAALEVAKKLGIPPERFLYLGDTSIDMKTALAAGMFAVGALWGFRDRAELLESGAQALVERPEDILQFFG